MRLPQAVMRASSKAAPKSTATGKLICWDHSCHMGCKLTADTCPRSHETIKGYAGSCLELQCQFLRRGGLKTGQRVTPDKVPGRIEQLLAQIEAEKAAKMASPTVARGASWTTGAGWNPPQAFTDLQLTEAEAPLGDALAGPDPTWLKDAHGKLPTEVCTVTCDAPADAVTQKLVEKLEAE